MRFDIRYRMRFDYDADVSESQNEVRVRPVDSDRQRVASYRLSSFPPARPISAVDYWGTNVDHLGIRGRHRSLELIAEAAVDTEPEVGPEVDASRRELAALDFRTEHWEFLQPSAHVEWDGALAEDAATCAAGHDSVVATVDAVVEAVRSSLRYETGSTAIGVSLADLRVGGAGVCQDFAHLAIGMLRSLGIPARYVSGYLFAADETQAQVDDDAAVSVQTHAWIEAAVPGGRWVGRDPTNGGAVGERHVVIGRARDYDDVPPMRGVFNGAAVAQVDAEVVIAVLGPTVPGPPLDPDVRSPELPTELAAQQWRAQQQQ